MRRAWLFEVSETPSRRWKQFLLSGPYEHSKYLSALEGDNLRQGKVSPTSTLMYAFSFMLW